MKQFPATSLAGPAHDGVDTGYWEGLRAGELRLLQCGSCASWIWGPRWMCGHCHSFDLEWARVEAQGRVYSWTRSWHPFIAELGDHLPYVSLLVELYGADSSRVLGLLAENDTEGIAIGDEVSGIIQVPEDSSWPVLRWQRTVRARSYEGGRHGH